MPGRPLHIIHILPALPFGGAERCVVDIVNQASTDFRFTILTFSNQLALAEEITNPTCGLKIVPKRGKLALDLVGRLEQTLVELRPDIVHTHLFAGDVWGRLAARRLRVPVVTTEHNLNIGEKGLRNFIRFILRNQSDRYAACSEAVAAYMRRVYRITKPITVIKYGIALNRFASIPPLNPVLSEMRILMLGRLVPQKGFDIGLRALALIKQYPWRLKIVGQGPLRGELQTLVDELGLSERVTFVPPTHQVPELFEQSDVLLMPSRWEGLGIVAMEAMAAGRLVVANQVDGLAELFCDAVTGCYIKQNTPQGVAERLAWCFNNWSEVCRIAVGAKAQAQVQFGVARMVRSYEAWYHLAAQR